MSVRAVVLAALVTLVAFGSVRPAAAQDPNAVFGGQIMVSDKKFPQSAKSQDAFIAAIRKGAKSNFYENKTDHTWKVYFTAFLKAPLNDLEYVVKIYELQGRSQQMLVSFDQYTDERGQRALSSYMTLERKTVGVNKQLLMTIESKGKMLAQAHFKILGEGDKFSGKVDFSQDDTEKKDDDN